MSPKRTDADARRLTVIRERVRRGAYVVSFTHTEKLRRRRISAHNVEEAVANGARQGRVHIATIHRDDEVVHWAAAMQASPTATRSKPG